MGLTLARKFDSVHRNTTTSSSAIPRVRRATPPKPSFSLMFLGAVVVVVLVVRESDVSADDGARESGAWGSVANMAAVTECDLRREEEEGWRWWWWCSVVCGWWSGARSAGRSGSVGAILVARRGMFSWFRR